jgi:hypothetical protein
VTFIAFFTLAGTGANDVHVARLSQVRRQIADDGAVLLLG